MREAPLYWNGMEQPTNLDGFHPETINSVQHLYEQGLDRVFIAEVSRLTIEDVDYIIRKYCE